MGFIPGLSPHMDLFRFDEGMNDLPPNLVPRAKFASEFSSQEFTAPGRKSSGTGTGGLNKTKTDFGLRGKRKVRGERMFFAVQLPREVLVLCSAWAQL